MRLTRSILFVFLSIWLVGFYHVPAIHARIRRVHTFIAPISITGIPPSDLIGAIWNNDETKVRELLKNPDSPAIATIDTVTNGWGQTALMIAAERGNLNIVELLVNKRANKDLTDQNGRTALMFAAERGDRDIVSLLVDKANKDLTDKNGWTALMFAAYNGHTEVVQFLHDSKAAGLAEANLILAIKSGNPENVRKSIQDGARINLKDIYDEGKTLLMLATEAGQNEIVEILLKNSADVNARNNWDETALMMAAYQGDTAIAETLLDYAENKKILPQVVNAQDDQGWTALMFAASEGQTEMINILLNHHANVNAVTPYVPSYVAVEFGQQGGYGYTALSLAAELGQIESVKRLLSAKERDIDAATSEGYTALSLAAENGYLEIVNMLIDNGARVKDVVELRVIVETLNNKGEEFHATARQLARIHGHPEFAQDNTQGGMKPQGNIMPNLVGRSLAQATQELQRVGLNVSIQGSTSSSALVHYQAPLSGTTVSTGSTITLFTTDNLWDGETPRGNVMPNVVGRSVAQAFQELQRQGIPLTIQGYSNLALTVVRQQPPAGTILSPGIAITLFTGEGMRGPGIQSDNIMPNLVGHSVAQAVWELQRRGFPVTIQGYANRTLPIIHQVPQAGTMLSPGMAITLFTSATDDRPGIQGGHNSPSWPLNTGGQTLVPDLFGLPQTDAMLAIQKAGLVVGRMFTTAINERSGLVMNQSPRAHTLVPINTIVDLSISQ